jgi:hypothetical protein
LLEVVNSHALFYTVEEYQCYWYVDVMFEIIKFQYNATETVNNSTKLECARCDTPPALQKEFTARKVLYAKEHEDKKRACDAPLVAVCRICFLGFIFQLPICIGSGYGR